MYNLTKNEREIFYRVMRGDVRDDSPEAMMARLERTSRRQMEIMRELEAADPTLGLTALLMAGDIVTAERATDLVAAGIPAIKALNYVGSYARFEWAVQNLTDAEIFPMLCKLWQAADPDDTDPRFLELWKRARAAAGGKCLRDGAALPMTKHIKIWRGQLPNSKPGCAWSRDRATAIRFAKGASYRRPTCGELHVAWVARVDVLGYVTGRGEQEVIVDPATLLIDEIEARVVKVRRRIKGANGDESKKLSADADGAE